MARKIPLENSSQNGVKAPEKSFKLSDHLHDFTVDNKHTNKANKSNGEKHQTRRNYTNTSAKEEICEVTSIRNNGPGIVARLMGITALPLDLGAQIQTIGKKKLDQNKKQNEVSLVGHASQGPIFVHSHEQQKSLKLKSREYPQQEELKKFKKDVSMWKVSGYRDPSRVSDVDSIQKYLCDSNENSDRVDIATHLNYGRADINKSTKLTSSQQRGKKKNKPMIRQKESMTSRNMNPCDYSDSFHPPNNIETMDIYSAPTRIVILKPGPDQSGSDADDCPSSSASSGGKYNNMEDLLEEMRASIKKELLWRKNATVFEAANNDSRSRELLPYGRPFDPRKIAQHIANQVRENVTRDLETSLLWSEPLRPYKSDILPDNPKGLLSERVRNYTEIESSQSICSSADQGSVVGAMRGTKNGTPLPAGARLGWRGDIREPVMGQFGSCRHISSDNGIYPHDLSSRNLIRSLSAPVKAESVAKLFEDHHVLNVADSRRCEVGETTYEDAKKPRRRAKFNFREKISNFRHSFTFGGGLFSKKLQHTVPDPHTYRGFMDDIMSGPTVVRYPGDVHENFTEVPPSPVSARSSSESDAEFGRFVDDINHVTPTDLTFTGYDIISDKRELKFGDADEEAGAPAEAEMVDPAHQNKAHVDDFLVAASGSCGNKSDTILAHRKHEWGREEIYEADEDISATVDSPAGMTEFRQKMCGKSRAQVENGRKLMGLVWDAVKEYIHLKEGNDFLVTGDVRRDDEANGVGEEIEELIMEEMVEEMSKEMVDVTVDW